MGLVETGVGLVPAWGGCTEMLLRHTSERRRPGGPMPPIMQVFEALGLATVSSSAADAKRLRYLRPEDGVTMNRDRLLGDAKARALAMVDGYRPPEPPSDLHLPGPTAKAALELALHGHARLGRATAHDRVVGAALADVLAGGGTDITLTLSEEELLALERRSFMRLLRDPASVARIEQCSRPASRCATDVPLPRPAARHAVRPARAAGTRAAGRSSRARGVHPRRRRRRAAGGGKACRGRAGSPQPPGRRGRLHLRDGAVRHRGVQGGLRDVPRRRLDRHGCRCRVGRPGPAQATQPGDRGMFASANLAFSIYPGLRPRCLPCVGGRRATPSSGSTASRRTSTS